MVEAGRPPRREPSARTMVIAGDSQGRTSIVPSNAPFDPGPMNYFRGRLGPKGRQSSGKSSFAKARSDIGRKAAATRWANKGARDKAFDDDVWLHHRIVEPKTILPLIAPPYWDATAPLSDKLAQMTLEMSVSLTFT
jgi:hypothetical protein